MKVHARSGAVRGLSVLAGLGLVAGMVSLSLADEATALRDDVIKVAALLEKKDTAGAEKIAAESGKKAEIEDLMALFALRKGKNAALGIGKTAGAIQPDGIEKKLGELSKSGVSDKDLADHADAYKDMGLQTAAIAVMNGAHEVKDDGKKKAADWKAWSKELGEAGLALAEAAGKKDASGVKAAAAKADATCSKCHKVFRE
jgi:hypothetical protein